MKTTEKNVSKKTNKKSKKVTKKPNKKVTKKNVKYKRRIVGSIFLGIIIIISIILILFSKLFNIKQITVINNFKISTEEIIKNSTLQLNNNMFKTLKSTIKNGIKSNPYIEDVKITKKLNGEIVLDIEERIATYALENEGNYIYINNQGYMLEIAQTQAEIPIIKGYTTTELVLGSRLNIEDLEKLNTVIQIMEATKSNKINDIIFAIDITDDTNFILEIPTENKTVQFGDKTNINVKILWIIDLISKEKGIEGEIIVNVPDIKKVYFREKV